MSKKPTVVVCPTCGKDVAWLPENKWKPFCSERCKLIDLGEWATEKYKVPVHEVDGPDETLGQ
ncbi:MAG: DNA gyrase inhibitor YacG [Thiobacillus sp.]|nr:DNA gyrase inhibitor YacG [Thiobacillus sp.]